MVRNVTGGDLDAARHRRLTVPLTDIIQTTAATLDLETGALVEASTYYPNGARETLQTDTDPSATEPMGFTGKESDDEVGLTYFGERYLIARVGRWAAPDPLHVHAAGGGSALNAYHYVSGNLLQGRDPIGLVCGEDQSCASELSSGGNGATASMPDGSAVQAPEGELTSAPAAGETPVQAAVARRARAQAAQSRVATYRAGETEPSAEAVARGQRRLDGALALVGGGMETLAGAAAASTPTVVGQVVGGAAVLHGLDVATAGATQFVTGERVSSSTHDALETGAAASGATEAQAEAIATTGEAVLGLALGGGSAARAVAPVRGPPATLEAAQRIQQASGRPPFAQTVVLMETQEGPTIAAGGRRLDLTDAQVRLAQEMGYTPARPDPTLDAELTAMQSAAVDGLTYTRGVATNNVCGNCSAQIEALGGRVQGRYFSF